MTRKWVGLLLTIVSFSASAECVSTLQPVAQIASSPNRPVAHIAWSGAVYGVTKVEPQTPSNPIWFAVYDTNLNPVTFERLVAAESSGGPVALLWDGGGFALFYEVRERLVMQQF